MSVSFPAPRSSGRASPEMPAAGSGGDSTDDAPSPDLGKFPGGPSTGKVLLPPIAPAATHRRKGSGLQLDADKNSQGDSSGSQQLPRVRPPREHPHRRSRDLARDESPRRTPGRRPDNPFNSKPFTRRHHGSMGSCSHEPPHTPQSPTMIECSDAGESSAWSPASDTHSNKGNSALVHHVHARSHSGTGHPAQTAVDAGKVVLQMPLSPEAGALLPRGAAESRSGGIASPPPPPVLHGLMEDRRTTSPSSIAAGPEVRSPSREVAGCGPSSPAWPTPQDPRSPEGSPTSPSQITYRVVWPKGVRSRRTREMHASQTPGGRVLTHDTEFTAAEPAGGGWVRLPCGRFVPMWRDNLPVVEPIIPEQPKTLAARAFSIFDIVVRCVLGGVFVWLVLKVLLDLQLTCGSADATPPPLSPTEVAAAPALTPAEADALVLESAQRCGLGQGAPSSDSNSGNIASLVIIVIVALVCLHFSLTAIARHFGWSERPLLLATLPLLFLFWAADLAYQILFELVACIGANGERCWRYLWNLEEDSTADEVESALNLDEVAPLLADTTKGVLAVCRAAGFENFGLGIGICMGYKGEDVCLMRGVPLREAICGLVRRRPDLFPPSDDEAEEDDKEIVTPRELTAPTDAPTVPLPAAIVGVVPHSPPLIRTDDSQRRIPHPAAPAAASPLPTEDLNLEAGMPRVKKSRCRRFRGMLCYTPFLSASFFFGFPCLFFILTQYGMRHCTVTSKVEFYGVMTWTYLGPYTGESILLYQRARGLILLNMHTEGTTALDVQNQFLMEWASIAILGHIFMTAYFLCLCRTEIMWLVLKARRFLRQYCDRYEAGIPTQVCGSTNIGQRMANLCRVVVMPALLGATLGAKSIFILSFTPAVSQWLEKLIWATLDRQRSCCNRLKVVIGAALFASIWDLVDDLPNNIALFWVAVQVIEENTPGSQELAFFQSRGGGCADILTVVSIVMQWMVFLVLSYFLIKPGLCAVLTAAASHLPTVRNVELAAAAVPHSGPV